MKKILGLGLVIGLLVGSLNLGLKVYKNYILEDEYNNNSTLLQQTEEIYKLMYSIEANDTYIVELEYYLNNEAIEVINITKENTLKTTRYIAHCRTYDNDDTIELVIYTNKLGIIYNTTIDDNNLIEL